jgi:hypothetical protein
MPCFLSGNYSKLRLSIHLKRTFGYYMIQTYIPSMLVVILSWVNFWLDARATPARISVGLLTVLTITTQVIAMVGLITYSLDSMESE